MFSDDGERTTRIAATTGCLLVCDPVVGEGLASERGFKARFNDLLDVTGQSVQDRARKASWSTVWAEARESVQGSLARAGALVVLLCEAELFVALSRKSHGTQSVAVATPLAAPSGLVVVTDASEFFSEDEPEGVRRLLEARPALRLPPGSCVLRTLEGSFDQMEGPGVYGSDAAPSLRFEVVDGPGSTGSPPGLLRVEVPPPRELLRPGEVLDAVVRREVTGGWTLALLSRTGARTAFAFLPALEATHLTEGQRLRVRLVEFQRGRWRVAGCG